jgi:predicted dehydrogenase
MAYQLHCVRTGAEPSATGRDGLAEVRLCDAIHQSMETGTEVCLA